MKKVIISLFFTLSGLPFLAQELDFAVETDFLPLPEGIVLKEVYDVAVNTQGELFVLARGPLPVTRFTVDGKFLGSMGEGLFNQVHSITIDQENNIWITDVGLHTVFKMDQTGRVLMVLGRQNNSGEFYTEKIPLFNKPADVIISDNGDIFVADGYGNSRIVKFDNHGNFINTWGIKGTGNGEFNLPHSLEINEKDLLLVADRENSRIQVFDLDGNFMEAWEYEDNIYCLAIDNDGSIYATLGKAPGIMKLDPDGKVLGYIGSEGKGPGQFVMPHGIAAGPDNGIYVTEPFNWRVEKFIVK